MTNETMQTDVFRRLSNRPRRWSALRLAPMIDVIFLLLIFFLVAAKWRPEEDFLPFKPPAAHGQDTRIGKPEPLLIFISPAHTGCRIRIGRFSTLEIENQNIEKHLAKLMEEIRDCMLAQKRFATDPVEIVCDPGVKWEHLAKIYNVFFGAGLNDITLRMTE